MPFFWDALFRKGRIWAIAVRRGSYKSLFLLSLGRFSLEAKGNSVLNFGSRKTVEIAWPNFFPFVYTLWSFVFLCFRPVCLRFSESLGS